MSKRREVGGGVEPLPVDVPVLREKVQNFEHTLETLNTRDNVC